MPFAWITGDCVYGADSAIRRWAERHRRGYVLAVTSGQRLALQPVTSWIEKLPKRAWQRLSAGDGAKGPRFVTGADSRAIRPWSRPGGRGLEAAEW